MTKAILLISCPDKRGITASVIDFISQHQGNILHASQHLDEQSNTFFIRVQWDLDGFQIDREDIHQAFSKIAHEFQMNWKLYFSDQKIRMAIFVSKHLHCLQDLLMRHASGQLDCQIPVIISNHSDAKSIADYHGIEYHEIPITKENKKEQETREIEILKSHDIDLVVLARYHQILTGDFISNYLNQIINIHHSFLPAFVGKQPYDQAYQKGVKLIGATGHYVNEDLDQGPIIEQDTARVSHRDTVEDLKRKGEDLERIVFYRAIRSHLERKVFVYGNKTVVFD